MAMTVAALWIRNLIVHDERSARLMHVRVSKALTLIAALLVFPEGASTQHEMQVTMLEGGWAMLTETLVVV